MPLTGEFLPQPVGGRVDHASMIRPCYLVVDREFASSISTRKLFIEAAKLNVITAYSGVELWQPWRNFWPSMAW